MRILTLLLFTAAAYAADLNDLARNPEVLRSVLKNADLKKGTSFVSDHENVLFAVETDQTPALVIDDGATIAMTHVGYIWTLVARLTHCLSHTFHYFINGDN